MKHCLKNYSEKRQKLQKLYDILINANNIAIVRTDKLGDMVLTLPLCRAVKNRFPTANLNLIASSYTKPLVDNLDILDNTYFIEDYQKGINSILEENKFDVIFFPRPRFNEYLAAFKNKVPLRIGSGYRLYSFLLNYPVYEHRKESKFNEAEYNTHLLSHILNEIVETELVKPNVRAEDLKKINKILDSKLLDKNKRFIIVHPGSGGSAYDWDIKNFAILAKKLNHKNVQIVLTGNKNEKAICKSILDSCPECIDLSGEINLYELIALISKSSVLIANSTGVLHIAASLGIAVVGLYPNTAHISQKRWGPYTDNKIIVSPPNNDNKMIDDMSLIDVNNVFDAVLEFIDI